jgi:YfiH family protein
MILKSDLLSRVPGIAHGFGTREEPVPPEFKSAWELRPDKQQVHGAAVAEVTKPRQELGEVDALYSRIPGIPIQVITADCVPILLARRDGGVVAAIHAGWRGTRARILEAVWDRLAREGERASDWVAAIGPAIGPCCYEVSEELAADFGREFGPACVPRHRHLDLPWVNQAALEKIGFARVERLKACTRCSVEPEFFSYRRDGSGHRQWSVIRIEKGISS